MKPVKRLFVMTTLLPAAAGAMHVIAVPFVCHQEMQNDHCSLLNIVVLQVMHGYHPTADVCCMTSFSTRLPSQFGQV
jgi:hypothetical protein